MVKVQNNNPRYLKCLYLQSTRYDFKYRMIPNWQSGTFDNSKTTPVLKCSAVLPIFFEYKTAIYSSSSHLRQQQESAESKTCQWTHGYPPSIKQAPEIGHWAVLRWEGCRTSCIPPCEVSACGSKSLLLHHQPEGTLQRKLHNDRIWPLTEAALQVGHAAPFWALFFLIQCKNINTLRL